MRTSSTLAHSDETIAYLESKHTMENTPAHSSRSFELVTYQNLLRKQRP